ncbi:hypothetical protein [Streptomyces sp. NPDC059957]|uniref:hypothetical protein n=1 Tax=unclassified Streptomyces TaxID=2593676 RepID=UPI00364A3527
MGLFAQAGGTDQPQVWRAAFVVLAVIGCASTLRLLSRARGDRFLTGQQAAATLLYALIAVVGAFPELADPAGLRPIQAEALLLIGLSSGIVEGHVNRDKTLKRATYGRASFGLLRTRIRTQPYCRRSNRCGGAMSGPVQHGYESGALAGRDGIPTSSAALGCPSLGQLSTGPALVLGGGAGSLKLRGHRGPRVIAGRLIVRELPRAVRSTLERQRVREDVRGVRDLVALLDVGEVQAGFLLDRQHRGVASDRAPARNDGHFGVAEPAPALFQRPSVVLESGDLASEFVGRLRGQRKRCRGAQVLGSREGDGVGTALEVGVGDLHQVRLL